MIVGRGVGGVGFGARIDHRGEVAARVGLDVGDVFTAHDACADDGDLNWGVDQVFTVAISRRPTEW